MRLFKLASSEKVGQILARNRGVGPGFDFLRILLAVYIFYGHALWLGGPINVEPTGLLESGFGGWTRPIHVAVVPVFFALSGFLISGSAIRLKAVSTFLAFRGLRIFPALIVEVTLCALILGPAFTEVSWSEYFSSEAFFRYFGNILGLVTYELPGLFVKDHVTRIVNANLWTLPAEFDCYLLTAGLMAFRIFYNRKIFTWLFGFASVLLIALSFVYGFGITPAIASKYLITYYFFVGVLFYHWADKIPVNLFLAIASAVVGYCLLMFKELAFIAPIFPVYCMVYFGMVKLPSLPIIRTGDYSYGIYLYGFPITQGLIAAAPNIFAENKFVLLVGAGLLTFVFSIFSWHVIEKRCLPLKAYLPKRYFPMPLKVKIAET